MHIIQIEERLYDMVLWGLKYNRVRKKYDGIACNDGHCAASKKRMHLMLF